MHFTRQRERERAMGRERGERKTEDGERKRETGKKREKKEERNKWRREGQTALSWYPKNSERDVSL